MPGLKRPWSIEPDEVSQPLCDVGADEGVGVPCPRDPLPDPGDRIASAARVASSLSRTVRSETAAGRPQWAQKRLSAVSGAWQ